MHKFTVAAADDSVLATYHWPAPATAAAIVIIIHGMAEHSRRYATCARQLAAAGAAVYAFDLRGHGATTAAVDHGHLGSGVHWQTLINDVAVVREFALANSGARPVVLLGHSLGSYIAQAVLQARGRDYAGAILSAPANPGRLASRLGALLAAMEAVRVDATGHSRLLHHLTFGSYARRLARRLRQQRTPADWLSSDAAVVDAYIADPQCGFELSVASWQCLLHGIARTQSPHQRRRMPADLPLLLIAGSDDAYGRFGAAPQALAGAYRNIGQRDVELRLYPGARHEPLQDSSAGTVVHDILAWFSQHNLLTAAPTHTGSSPTCDN